eukprot:g665.t1
MLHVTILLSAYIIRCHDTWENVNNRKIACYENISVPQETILETADDEKKIFEDEIRRKDLRILDLEKIVTDTKENIKTFKIKGNKRINRLKNKINSLEISMLKEKEKIVTENKSRIRHLESKLKAAEKHRVSALKIKHSEIVKLKEEIRQKDLRIVDLERIVADTKENVETLRSKGNKRINELKDKNSRLSKKIATAATAARVLKKSHFSVQVLNYQCKCGVLA